MPAQYMPHVCTNCGSTEHWYAKGLCSACYQQTRYRPKPRAERQASQPCTHCGTTTGQQYIKGMCQPCYIRDWNTRHPESRKRTYARSDAKRKGTKRVYDESRRDARRASTARWRRDNPERFAESNRESSHIHRAHVGKVRISHRAVYERDGGICHICSKPVPYKVMSLDHVVPLVHGGAHSFTNVRCSHRHCNISRRHLRPAQPYLI